MSRSATAEAARRFVAVWERAWAAHDVDTIVGLYAEECVHRAGLPMAAGCVRP